MKLYKWHMDMHYRCMSYRTINCIVGVSVLLLAKFIFISYTFLSFNHVQLPSCSNSVIYAKVCSFYFLRKHFFSQWSDHWPFAFILHSFNPWIMLYCASWQYISWLTRLDLINIHELLADLRVLCQMNWTQQKCKIFFYRMQVCDLSFVMHDVWD